MTADVTDANFEAEVLQADKPVLVDFWAPWCGPCRMVSPIVDEIGEENADKLKVVKVNTDENMQTASTYGITSIPALYVFKDGQVAKTIIGAQPKPMLMQQLEEFLG
ncbi:MULTISPECIES: thioredoxin [Brevibacterium]|uniref:Thioredoxin n=1 Tax=Brevibacterium luteolum TaxID=199591 RepID=A0A2N6PGD6_9MICO|nr:MULTISPECIES: thioredoxin [Brevibacterium]MBM7530011.1 thioredoxin 1 [Brevibacterium luteolum]MBU8579528.1 thioredoxin [Brevibacterium luteolum]MCT1656066.1 thioredoxin [Brevibacterium luteolum]MCT1828832.1 thioredoxin [Brevibacterium luteolum]MCT1874180.1 thioredoxin [Brevibacterium luteolum]